MFQRALNGYKKALGPDHSLTLNTVRILDNLYTDQGKLREAQHMTTATVVRFEDGTSWYVKIPDCWGGGFGLAGLCRSCSRRWEGKKNRTRDL
jgi:hypothetical protein